MGSLLRQLAEQTSRTQTTRELKQSYSQNTGNRHLSADDLFTCICTVSKDFDAVYMFVEALDECPENSRNELLARIQDFSTSHVRIFLTSRPHIRINLTILDVLRIDFTASVSDITAFLESEIHKSGRLSRFIARDPELKQHIVNGIVDKADGKFLLASLQINSLCKQTSPKQIKKLLKSLPADVFTTYNDTFARIRDQFKEDADLAMKAILMVFNAKRPLEIEELRHALAVEPQEVAPDIEALTDLEIIFSVTAGLITTFQGKARLITTSDSKIARSQ